MSLAGITVDARILGRLFVAQSTFSIFSEYRKMGAFIRCAVEEVPGVASCAVCMPGAEGPRFGNEPAPECAGCDVLKGDINHAPGSPCRLSDRADIRAYPLRTQDRHFGFLLIKVEDGGPWAPYEPFVGNMAYSLAVNIESQSRRDRLEAANAELSSLRDNLEKLVQERTAALEASNQILRGKESHIHALLEESEQGRRTLLGILEDMRLAEEEIRKLNAELERRVEERTVQLATANKELEAFSYSVSHDLRAPLRAVDGFSYALLQDYAKRLDDEGQDYLKRIRAAAKRMGQLIDDMLTLSRISRATLRKESVDVSALARSVLTELEEAEPQRQVDVQIAENLHAEADPNLLRIALENLLGNAWKFTSKTPQAKIEFGQVGDTRPAPLATFFVRDNGAGFDMAYAEKLFGAFQRLHRQDEFPGTGIGLATVARIIHRHGGEVRAEGTMGQGATFFFTLEPEA